MSQFMFGVSRHRVSKSVERKLETIAKRHGAELVVCVLPGTGYQRWFTGPNYGAPFDGALSSAVYADIEREIPQALENPGVK